MTVQALRRGAWGVAMPGLAGFLLSTACDTPEPVHPEASASQSPREAATAQLALGSAIPGGTAGKGLAGGVPPVGQAQHPTTRGSDAVAAASRSGLLPVHAPPPSLVASLRLSPFYKKWVSVGGLPILGSQRVSEAALREAAYLVERMLQQRPRVLQALVDSKIRVVVMSYQEMTTDVPEHSNMDPAFWDRRARGLGPGARGALVTVGEENLLSFPGDPYAKESIFVHEFAHAIAGQGLPVVHPTFSRELQEQYRAALGAGLWAGKYASQNAQEYWAELVQSWFDTNRENDREHNHVNTREELITYDPQGSALVRRYLGDSPWRFAHPKLRRHQAHLAQVDRALLPRFRWPERVLRAFRRHQSTGGLKRLVAQPGSSVRGQRSPKGGTPTTLRFQNKGQSAVHLYWIAPDGSLRPYGLVRPGLVKDQNTYAGHLWVAADAKGRPLWVYEVAEKACLAVIP